MKWINELQENERIRSSYLVTNVTRGVTNNNMPYLTVTLQDKTGQIEGKKWEATNADNEMFQAGNIVEIEADVINYRNGLQMKIISGTSLDQSDIDATLYTMSAPIEQAELVRRLDHYIHSIQDEDIRRLVEAIVQQTYQDFITYPAAVRNHHEYTNGLLYHTLSMANLAEMLSSYYDHIDRDLLLGGVLLHDIGKTIELSGPIIAKYTKEGKLIGHISIMHSMIRETAKRLAINDETRVLLEHMILSHHGKHEFGSPVLPMTREAILLHMIDDLDAKMTIIDKALSGIEEGEFTAKVYPLEERSLYKPLRHHEK